MSRFTTLAVVLAAGLVLAAAAAHANSPRVTKGDAKAVFEAFPNGGSAGQGAPSDGLVDGRTAIRPFVFFNGKHYCVLDWHVALITFFADGPHETAAAELAALTATFWIDGSAVATDRTAVKRSLRPNGDYWTSTGVLLSPAALAVGRHTLRVQTSDGFDNTITFAIDAAGTGTCL